jgi:hypothetical protein
MHIYIFGSYVRGEIDTFSDVDLLQILQKNEESDLDKNKFSIYYLDRLLELWNEGNPFAWHLYYESKLIFSSDDNDLLRSLGEPAKYNNLESDLKKFYILFNESLHSYKNSNNSKIFDLSMIFLAIRNFATCFSLGKLNKANFSRDSALRLGKLSLNVSNECFLILQRARILSTRGNCDLINEEEFNKINLNLNEISIWFEQLYKDYV